MRDIYQRQVSLLLETMPYIAEERCFALKGGTALNLFFRDMPRLSVDIDLCYLPIQDRNASFKSLHSSLKSIKSALEKNLQCKVKSSQPLNNMKEARLVVENADTHIKIEPNYVIRGALFPAVTKSLSTKAAKEFKVEIECRCLDLADLMGGKICAALDRQHPRDLFDIWYFQNNENWTRRIIDAFLYYLVSHNRPIHELLNPNLLPIQASFDSDFNGMTTLNVTVDDLLEARLKLTEDLRANFKQKDKDFLISVSKGDPNWDLSYDLEFQNKPSVKWKMFNISKMSEHKKQEQTAMLEKVLEHF